MKKYSISFLIIFLVGVLFWLSPVFASPLSTPVNPGLTNLVAYWSLDETSGTRNDSHSTNHLTDFNTVSYDVGVFLNSASFVSGNSEYLAISDNVNISMGNIDFSVCGWINLSNKSTNTAVISKANSAVSNREYMLYYSSSLDLFVFLVSSNGASATIVNATTFGSPSVSTWYYLCGWHNATTDTIGISVNAGAFDTTSHTSGVYNGTTALSISRYNAVSYSTFLADEVLIYKKALSADEIEYLYNSGLGRQYCDIAGTCPTPTPTITFTPSNTFTNTPDITNTFTNTPEVTSTFTNTSVFTNTFTPTLEVSSTYTPTFTSTFTTTLTFTNTFTPTYTITPDIFFSPTPTFTVTPDIDPYLALPLLVLDWKLSAVWLLLKLVPNFILPRVAFFIFLCVGLYLVVRRLRYE